MNVIHHIMTGKQYTTKTNMFLIIAVVLHNYSKHPYTVNR